MSSQHPVVLEPDRERLVRQLHRAFVKPIVFKYSSQIIQERIAYLVKPFRSALDISAGDDMVILNMALSGMRCIANDYDPATVAALKHLAREVGAKLEFTNCDMRTYPAVDVDVVLCKNTLHHLADEADIAAALRHLSELAPNQIIVDVEAPDEMLRARLWHQYYRTVLKEDDHHFLTYPVFQRLVAGNCGGRVWFERWMTIKGRYMVAYVQREMVNC